MTIPTSDISTETTTLGEPFNSIFETLEAAHAGLDLIRRAAVQLGATSADDERVAITYRQTEAGIHFSFCSWLILGFYPANRPHRMRLALPVETGTALGLEGNGGDFAERPGHEDFGLFGMYPTQIGTLSPKIETAFFDGLDTIREIFANQKKSQFRRHHSIGLGNAVFDKAKREEIIISGLPVAGPSGAGFHFGDQRYRVRTPYHWRHSQIRRFIHAVEGQRKSVLMELFNRLRDHMGNPQNQSDWKKPDEWIHERLVGEQASLAMHIWQHSERTVNPRHMRGAYLFASNFGFINEGADGLYLITPVGRRYLDGDPVVMREVDRLEGSEMILRLFAKHGPSRRSDILQEWTAFTKAHSKFQSPDTIEAALTTRIRDLHERGLLDGKAHRYSVSAEGHAYLATFDEPEPVQPPIVHQPYTLDHALDGLFMTRDDLAGLIELFRHRRNVILQGPPGVGKTFVAKRVAYALMQEKAPERVEMIQFHQSYSYEDFIQGYRPREGGSGFALVDGVFHRFCRRAESDPEKRYVFIIDEINRGNLSKIFGELMMLVEADKRGPDFAIPLTYSPGERFHVPENVYLLGMMNTADRSLAMVDYALRRRFAFVDLEPAFNDRFVDWMVERMQAPEPIARRIVDRLAKVNGEIEKDRKNLGPGFRIGHSYFCNPNSGLVNEVWYERIVRYEIAPLLREYWFDDEKRADGFVDELLAASESL